MTKMSDPPTTMDKSLLIETSNGWELYLAEMVDSLSYLPRIATMAFQKYLTAFLKYAEFLLRNSF